LLKQSPTSDWYAYDVLFGGDTIVSNSRDPEHDLARALLARGIKGLVEVRDDRTSKPRSLVNIEEAAKWCVGSNLERYRFRPLEIADSSPPASETDPLGRERRPSGARPFDLPTAGRDAGTPSYSRRWH
jgi:hypothetical protein